MKKFLYKSSFFFLVPLIIMGINFEKDPANLFNSRYESGIVNYLSNGYNVTNLTNYNERLLQKYYVNSLITCPSTIILGSSRIMQMHHSFLNVDDAVNNGVSGATLEDEVSIYSLYDKKNFHVKKVILGLDPWMLNDHHDQVRWKDLIHEYYEFMNVLRKDKPLAKVPNDDEYSKYQQLLSLSYFKESFKNLKDGVDKSYKPVKSCTNQGFTKLIDGSIVYNAKIRMSSQDEIDQNALALTLHNPVYSLGNFNHLSENYKDVLTRFVGYLLQNHIEVQFYLSPYHPIVYQYFKQKPYYSIVFSAERYYRNLAAAHSIKVYGSFNPSVCQVDHTYFYDGLHCNEKAIQKILGDSKKL